MNYILKPCENLSNITLLSHQYKGIIDINYINLWMVSNIIRCKVNNLLQACNITSCHCDSKMATSSTEEESEDSLPKYGWRVHLDNTFSHKPPTLLSSEVDPDTKVNRPGMEVLFPCGMIYYFFFSYPWIILNKSNCRPAWVVDFSLFMLDLWSTLQGKERMEECRLSIPSPQTLVDRFMVSQFRCDDVTWCTPRENVKVLKIVWFVGVDSEVFKMLFNTVSGTWFENSSAADLNPSQISLQLFPGFKKSYT